MLMPLALCLHLHRVNVAWGRQPVLSTLMLCLCLLGAAGSFSTFVIFFLVFFLLVVFCSAVATPEAAVGDTDDEDSVVEERGAAVEVDVTDIVDKQPSL